MVHDKKESIFSFMCGIQQRVAERLGVHRSYVSRVARGERSSNAVEAAIDAEMNEVLERLKDWAKSRRQSSSFAT
jgi:DNA-binding transcriptional regulator YdaS (Cro superfamily)